jgi:membrane protease YdiL (CAAX protease family)
MSLVLQDNAWVVVLFYVLIVAAGVVVDIGLVIRFMIRPLRWTEHATRLHMRPWTSREAFPLIGVLLLLYATGSLLRPPAAAERVALWMVVQSLVFHGVGLVIVVFTLLRRGIPWRSAFGGERGSLLADVGRGVLFYLAAMPFLAFYAAVYQGALKYTGYHPEPQEVALVFAAERSVGVRALLGVLAVVIAPVFEEILFRGVALPMFAKKWGVAPAVVAVSVFFAAIHFHVPSLVPLFVIAVAFSLAYISSGSIVVPMVMHALFNAVNVLLLVLLGEG